MPNWNQVLGEVQRLQAQGSGAIDVIRRHYVGELHKHLKRNIIAYYSGFLSKPDIQSDINDEDTNGFMMAVHRLDRSMGLDLILHTPGGGIAATQSIITYLQKMFRSDIRVMVPQMAMSAGTIMACCSREIWMSEKHSNLSPIDPHLNGFPAYGVIKEFERAVQEITDDPNATPIWQAIIGQYPPTYLSQCENAIKWSNRFVRGQLRTVMFKGKPGASRKAAAIVRKLTDYTGNKTHDRHIDFDECKRIGLNVQSVEKDKTLQDLLLTVHHCYMHSLMNTAAYKIIENHLGAAFVKQQMLPAHS